LYRPNPSNRNSLDHKSILTLIEDKNGDLWIGTDGGGLNFLEMKTQKFKHYLNEPGNINSLSSNAVVCQAEDFEGNIWVGTYAGGLNFLDRKTNKFTRYNFDLADNNSISSNDLWSMAEDKNHNLWIGTIAGTLNFFDRKTKKFYRYKKDINDPSSFIEAYTSQIFEDSRHYLWIATSNGLEMIKLGNYDFNNMPLKLKFNHYVHDNKLNSLSSNSIFTICEDYQGNMWFGTDEGILNKLNVGKNEFTAYTDKNGLRDIGIRATTIDKDNNIWINTVKGFWKFNIKEKSFRKFDESDGLQDASFSRASFLGKDGRLYVGGINGFNTFYPQEIPFNHKPPQVCITDFKVFNKSVKVGEKIEGNVILNKLINDINELNISYKINFFSFEFSALDFTNPSKNRYSYKLEGFDNQWRQTDSKNRTATYTNLDPGKYIFRVKACNNDGVWNETGTSIKLILINFICLHYL
jgi:ligand-binding sensor domain-containing protein